MKVSNRIKNFISNFSITILLQVCLVVSGFLVPRALLGLYGSDLFGITLSIGQFISYLLLLEAGIGISAIQRLYKPLAAKNTSEINSIITTARRNYKATAKYFIVFLVLLAFIYPAFARGEEPYSKIAILFFVMGLPSFLELLVHGKYRVLLTADQKVSIVSLVQIIGLVVGTILKLTLISNGISIILVQLVTTLVFILRIILIKAYTSRHYKYANFEQEGNTVVLDNRKYVLLHQIGGLVITSSQLVLVTIFLDNDAMSIYGVYNLVFSSILIILSTTFTKSITSVFGSIISSQSNENIVIRYRIMESLYFTLAYSIYTTAMFLIIPFIELYTDVSEGIDFVNMPLAILFVSSGMFYVSRIPSLTMVNSYGKFKETISHSVVEMVLNIVFSILGIIFFGVWGVLVGLLISAIYRMIIMIWFTSNNVLLINPTKSLIKVFSGLTVNTLLYFIITDYIRVETWIEWIIAGFILVFVTLFINLVVQLVYYQELKFVLGRIKRIKELVFNGKKTT